MMAAMNGTEDVILLIQADAKATESLTGATVRADEGFVVFSGKGRVGRICLPTLGADSLNCNRLFHLSSSVLLYS